jgi:hypothetical protein
VKMEVERRKGTENERKEEIRNSTSNMNFQTPPPPRFSSERGEDKILVFFHLHWLSRKKEKRGNLSKTREFLFNISV